MNVIWSIVSTGAAFGIQKRFAEDKHIVSHLSVMALFGHSQKIGFEAVKFSEQNNIVRLHWKQYLVNCLFRFLKLDKQYELHSNRFNFTLISFYCMKIFCLAIEQVSQCRYMIMHRKQQTWWLGFTETRMLYAFSFFLFFAPVWGFRPSAPITNAWPCHRGFLLVYLLIGILLCSTWELLLQLQHYSPFFRHLNWTNVKDIHIVVGYL